MTQTLSDGFAVVHVDNNKSTDKKELKSIPDAHILLDPFKSLPDGQILSTLWLTSKSAMF